MKFKKEAYEKDGANVLLFAEESPHRRMAIGASSSDIRQKGRITLSKT